LSLSGRQATIPEVDQLRNYGDERQASRCAYCAGTPETRDHVPSRVLLDEPYPENLPVVGACHECNQSFSRDEVYLACLIDAVLAGSASAAAVGRAKIARILREQPSLELRLAAARAEVNGVTTFSVDESAVRRVVLKLARGHALFELNEPRYDEPSWIDVIPLAFLETPERQRFETIGVGRAGVPGLPELAAWPEVGSRALQRLVIRDSKAFSDWVEVQPGRYRYAAIAGAGVVVRVVLSEYLACEVEWK
jgi:hypothetical protein